MKNLGFYDCVYSIEGQIMDGTKLDLEKESTHEGKYDTYKEGPEYEGKWKYLQVTCESKKRLENGWTRK